MSACNCDGACENCRREALSRAGGDQGLSPLEIEVAQLRAELVRLRREHAVLTSQRDLAVNALQLERTESRRAYERTRLAVRALKLNGGDT
jgi:hypothetical protein